ncbi:MAG: Hsp33 family molecular chaperone HslO [Pseudomonadota bacterium]|nr:Hsp33 family molecular chaperone HslO [Pseudomonadota bacterium]
MSHSHDLILPFHLNGREVRGRLVRLDKVANGILGRHDLPPAAASILGEGLALTALIASALKFDGIFTLQAQGDGPAGLLVADYRNHGDLRGYIRLADDFESRQGGPVTTLLGRGQLAFTVDPAGDSQRYQGLVSLTGDDLASCAEHYFAQSDQIPTMIRLASARGADGRWRVGGLMLQSLPRDPDSDEAEDDWRTAEALGRTVSAQELVDPSLDAADLVYRLFHEDGAWVHDTVALHDRCTCSTERVREVVRSFPQAEVEELAQDRDAVDVDCQFCGRHYVFGLDELLGAAS